MGDHWRIPAVVCFFSSHFASCLGTQHRCLRRIRPEPGVFLLLEAVSLRTSLTPTIRASAGASAWTSSVRGCECESKNWHVTLIAFSVDIASSVLVESDNRKRGESSVEAAEQLRSSVSASVSMNPIIFSMLESFAILFFNF